MLPNESYMKRQRIRSLPMRAAARGEDCTLNIMGACNHDPSTVVLAHLPDESGGIAHKSDDVSSALACQTCHAVIDGRVPWPDEFEEKYRDWYMRRAQTRTIRRMIEKGVIQIEGVKE